MFKELWNLVGVRNDEMFSLHLVDNKTLAAWVRQTFQYFFVNLVCIIIGDRNEGINSILCMYVLFEPCHLYTIRMIVYT